MKPIKVLLASANYPNDYYMWGPWNKEANVALSQNESLEVETVAPLPYSLPVKQFPYYNLSKIPKIENGPEGIIHRPRFLYILPKKLFYGLEGSLYQYSIEKSSKNFQKPDLVHCHHVYPDGYGFMNLCKKWDVPLIVDIHSSRLLEDIKERNQISKKISKTLQFANKIICISQEIKDSALKIGLEEEKIEFIPLGTDTDKFRPRDKNSLRKKYGIDKKHVIIYVGSLLRMKGVFELIKAVSILPEELKNDLKVFIIGDGPEKSNLNRLCKELRLENIIEFKISVNRDEIPFYYSASDLLVLPSFSEGRPVVIYEAMASGCPILSTYVGGIPEQVLDNVNGRLIKAGDLSQLKNEITFLLYNKNLLKKMGKKGLELIEKNELKWEDYSSRLTKIYMNMMVNK